MRRLIFITTAALALGGAATAIAWHGGLFKTDAVAAEFSASRTSFRERTCTGTDGHTYRDARAVLRGMVAPGDPRLTGRIVFRLTLREDLTARLGTAEGRMWILDGGGPKVSARVVGVIANGNVNGVFDGRVFRGSWLVANFSASWDGTTLRGELGQESPVAPANAAVIQSRFDVRCGRPGNGENSSGSGRLEVRKSLSPADDPGRFDLRIDGTAQALSVGNNGSTGEKIVAAGKHEVSEVPVGGAKLDDYTTSISCRDGNGAGTELAKGGADADLDVTVTTGADVVCTITNTHKTAATGKLEVRKSLSPADDSGRFDLKIDGTTYAAGVGNNGSTGERSVVAGKHAVSEVAIGGANLANYTTGISCRDGNGAGAELAKGGSDADLDVTIAAGADVVCTITNTRKTAATGKLEVRKDLNPSSDTSRFNLFVKQGSTLIDSEPSAGDGDSTGERSVTPGTYTVSETAAGGANLDNYTISISCRDGNGGGTEIAKGGADADLDVTVAASADVVCTITNTRKS